MESIAPPAKSPPGSPMSEDRVPHATPSIASIFPPNYSGSGGSASDRTIPQYNNFVSTIFPPTKSQTESSESNPRFGQFSHSIPSIFPPTKSQTDESSESNQRLTRFSQYSIPSIVSPTKSQTESSKPNQRFGQFSHSITSIFPPTKSQTDESSESNQRFGKFSHSIPSIFPPTKSQTDESSESNQRLTRFSQYSIPSIFSPTKSQTESSKPNQRFGQFSHSIPSIFPPTKSQTDQSSESNQKSGQFSHSIPSIFPQTQSQTDQSSESNERLTRFSQYSIPSIFQPNMSDDTNSLDSIPKDMQNTRENKRNIQSKKEWIDVPEFKDLRWSRDVCPYKQTLQRRLQRLIEDDVHMNWTYAIFWKFLSHVYSGGPILNWGFGYYQGDEDDLKAKTTSAVEEEHVKKMLVNLSLSNSGSVDEQEFTDTEWFFLASKMLSFVCGSDLPGKAFATSKPLCVAGVNSLAFSPYDRARQGQQSGLRTMLFVPFRIGVVELGSTEFLSPGKTFSPEAVLRILAPGLDHINTIPVSELVNNTEVFLPWH